MKLFKSIVVLSVVLLFSAVSWAGNTPEYDAVGYDDMNYFAQNIIYYEMVTAAHPGLESDSNFDPFVQGGYYGAIGNPLFMDLYERFETNAGQLGETPCYPILGALTDPWNQGTYEWYIVLQYKPETDLNINIMDCVIKHNEFDLWNAAEQTGRYRAPWGELIFLQASNPTISVQAYPGPYATAGFAAPVTLDARTLPGLSTVALNEVLYTSKAHFPEGIVVKLPMTGETNMSGQMEYNLKQGDVIHVTVNMPPNANTVDFWYGPDSVLVKYVGVVGTTFFANNNVVAMQ